MRITLPNGGFVGADDCAFFEVYSIDIDKKEKTMELNDEWGYVRGFLHYENLEEVEINHYNGEGELDNDYELIVINGQLKIKEVKE